MKYQFKRQDAIDFAMHVHQSTRIRGDEQELFLCPYCRGGSNKDKYTFSINLKTGLFKCLRSGCGQQGSMWRLAQDFDFKLSDEFSRYYAKKPQYRTLAQPKAKLVPKPKAIEYLSSRGISEDTAKAYQVTVLNDREDVLVFPVFDEHGTMVNVKYRNTGYVKGEKNGSKEWFESGCKPYLYGIQAFNGDFGTCILCEGQLDSMSVYEAGIENAFSVLGGKGSFTWFPACYDFISQFKEVIIFGDYENGQITLLDDMKMRLDCKVRHIREADYKDCKDANDILRKYGKEYLKEVVENAVCVPVRQVMRLADVKPVDMFKVEKVATGFKQLDRLLYGGLPFGTMALVSGKSGVGKSNLASQILVHALSQGYRCFAYSGELPKTLFRAWMDFQVAGTQHVTAYQNKWGEENFTISQANLQLIDNWYGDNMYIYDTEDMVGEETKSLFEVIISVIRQYGVRVILIDNLMTAMASNTPGNDKYERQSEFVKELVALAKKWRVLIILVAHKRKNSFSDFADDDVSGSSDTANLSATIIHYDKGTKDDECSEDERILRLTKNRVFGKTNNKGWICAFDARCKRIFMDNETINREYSAFPQTTVTNDGFIDVEQVELPWG